MKLYAVKINTQYLRQRPSGPEIVELDKASVYPQIENAQSLAALAAERGLSNLRVVGFQLVEFEV